MPREQNKPHLKELVNCDIQTSEIFTATQIKNIYDNAIALHGSPSPHLVEEKFGEYLEIHAWYFLSEKMEQLRAPPKENERIYRSVSNYAKKILVHLGIPNDLSESRSISEDEIPDAVYGDLKKAAENLAARNDLKRYHDQGAMTFPEQRVLSAIEGIRLLMFWTNECGAYENSEKANGRYGASDYAIRTFFESLADIWKELFDKSPTIWASGEHGKCSKFIKFVMDVQEQLRISLSERQETKYQFLKNPPSDEKEWTKVEIRNSVDPQVIEALKRTAVGIRNILNQLSV